jgi:peptidoglycan/LPS O-acetylase OafA/YrhL
MQALAPNEVNVPATRDGSRLTQVDGLRAVAALSVVFYHYTTRFDQVFVHSTPLAFNFPFGYLGVQLFFIISGFVIFLTLDAAKTPTDFVVSRFSRLYPTYWVALLASWLALRAADLPGFTPSVGELIANVTMVHEYFGIASVDGVYWSLGVEIMFYAWMLLFWTTGALKRPVLVVLGATLTSLVAAFADRLLGLHVPHTLEVLLLLKWSPWFALGMLVYMNYRRNLSTSRFLALASLAMAAVWIRGTHVQLLVALVSTFAVLAAARGRLAWAGTRPLVIIGLISYPLYLIHEKLGWIAILALERSGVPPTVAVSAVFAAMLGIAYVIHHVIEMPVQGMIRRAYRRHVIPGAGKAQFSDRQRWAFGAVAFLVLLSVGGRFAMIALRPSQPVFEKVNPVDAARHQDVACKSGSLEAQRVIVALGQSNAASHGARVDSEPISLFIAGRCIVSTDPLPGTTGSGSAIWGSLGRNLADTMPGKHVLFAPLAVGGSRIADWTSPDGLVRPMLEAHLTELRDSGLKVDAVLWQQGEADMLRGTPASTYVDELRALRRLLDGYGIDAPLFVAKSTFCRLEGTGAIRRALERKRDALAADRIFAGPDTDSLREGFRSDSCHFNGAGIERAAAMWAEVIQPTLFR